MGQDGAPAAQRGRTVLTHRPRPSTRLSEPEDACYSVVVQCFSGVMRMDWGRAELPRLPVIPSCCSRHAGWRRPHLQARRVRAWSGTTKQHAGSIKLATTPFGGQTVQRPRACCVRGAHAALLRVSARMCPSRSP